MKNVLFPKVLVVVLVLCCVNLSAFAQGDVFSKGDMIINAGVGLGTFINHDYKEYSGTVLNKHYKYSISVPPITGSFEYGIADLFDGMGGIGIGGYLGYILFKGSKIVEAGNINLSDKKFNLSDMIVGVRGLFHYQFIDNLDTYAGVMLGYDIVSFNEKGASEGSKPCSAFFVGGRYYFTNNFGVFGELGYGISPLQVGLTYKF